MNVLQSLVAAAVSFSSSSSSSVDAAAFTGLGSGFDDASVSAAAVVVEAQLMALETMSGHELIALFLTASSSSSMDGIDAPTDGSTGGSAWKYIRDLLVIDDPFLRSVMISRLGHLLIKLLILISSDDAIAHSIEGSMDNASSSADAKRAIDGAVDTVADLLRCYALGVMGRAPAAAAALGSYSSSSSSQDYNPNKLLVLADDFCCRNAYSEVLVYLIGSCSLQHHPSIHPS